MQVTVGTGQSCADRRAAGVDMSRLPPRSRRTADARRPLGFALIKVLVVSLIAGMTLSSCQTAPNLPSGAEAYQRIPAPAETAVRPYLIGPFDLLAVNTFREPDLTMENIQVDADGNIRFPLLGEIRAAGKTAGSLGQEIAGGLRGRYIERPQVTVLVKQSSSQTVTVIGSVTEPGVFRLQGPSTLLDALALAKGTTRISDLRRVVVFRTVNHKRMGALFDVRMIQRGEAADPGIEGQDTVVVGINHVEAAWRDVLLAAPLLAVFTAIQ